MPLFAAHFALGMIQVHDKHFKSYISRTSIEREVNRVAAEITASLGHDNGYFLGVLNGSFMFFADLMKQIPVHCEIGFMKAASYAGMESTGVVKFHEAGMLPVTGRDVVIVEDIIDTGNTLASLLEFLGRYNPKSIKVCTLLFKREAYKHTMPVDYVCFEVENKFLLGYGLDYNGLGRNLPEIYILSE